MISWYDDRDRLGLNVLTDMFSIKLGEDMKEETCKLGFNG